MAKEQRWREGHPPCDNNCGPYDGQAEAAAATCAASSCCSASSPSSSTCTADSGEAAAAAGGAVAETAAGGSIREVEAARRRRGCARCGRRVGLTGFACRCGATFCAAHRYPERHACGYDYKAAGREDIARANPVVKADKLPHKI